MATVQHWIDSHHQGLFRFAYSLCGQAGLAEQLVFSAFAEWARTGHLMCPPQRMKSWLFSTLYRDWLSCGHRGRAEFESSPPGVWESTWESGASIGWVSLHLHLMALEEQHRAPLVLLYLRELSYLEMAEVLGLSISTLLSRIALAKDELRGLLHRSPTPKP